MTGLITRTPRELTIKDLQRINLGRRYWDATLSQIPDSCGYKHSLTRWIGSIEENIQDGIGMLLFGEYGVGKTAGAAILCKAVVAHGGTALFCTGADLKRWTIDKPAFDEEQTYADRVRKVDLLAIDDPERGGDTAWTKATVEETVRARTAANRATVIATNLVPGTSLNDFFGEGLMQILLEAVHPCKCEGKSWRQEKKAEIKARMEGE